MRNNGELVYVFLGDIIQLTIYNYKFKNMKSQLVIHKPSQINKSHKGVVDQLNL